MLADLAEKAKVLQQEGKIPSPGYTVYSSSIKWVVHIDPVKNDVYVEEYSVENRPRPASSTRTGTKTSIAYPFSDESGYVLGNDKKKGGGKDKYAKEKHKTYMSFLEEMYKSSYFDSILLKEAIQSIHTKLQNGTIQNAFANKEVENKDWITFIYSKGDLSNIQLQDIPETKDFWAKKAFDDVCCEQEGQCCICGSFGKIVANMPTKVSLKGSRRQIASFNKNAFVSFRHSKDKAPLGICPLCAENSAQAMNYLLENSSKIIFEDKSVRGEINRDSTRNQTAMYWLKEDINLEFEGMQYNLLDIVQAPLAIAEDLRPITTEKLIKGMLESVWSGKSDMLSLDENTFYLCIVSPNTGRIIVRDWIHESAGKVKGNLVRYFNALKLMGPDGSETRPLTIQQLLEPLKDTNPNMAKKLVRCAYKGEQPDFSIFQAAINRLRVTQIRKKNSTDNGEINIDDKEKRTYEKKELNGFYAWHRLCTLIKFYLTYGREESENMQYESTNRNTTAYQCGKLLAILEEIQRRAATSKLSATIIERYYGSASTAPFTVLPMLLNRATKEHMPKIRKNNRGYLELENILEEVTTLINQLGGFPGKLLLIDQGEFALGFYCQRAKFNAERREKAPKNKNVGGAKNENVQ